MNADGSGVQRLSPPGVADYSPAWSPRGDLIAFASGSGKIGGTDLFVMQPDGKLSGEVRYKTSPDAEELRGTFEGHVGGKSLRLSGRMKFGNFEAEVEITGELDGDDLRGETRWKSAEGDDTRRLTGKRKPK